MALAYPDGRTPDRAAAGRRSVADRLEPHRRHRDLGSLHLIRLCARHEARTGTRGIPPPAQYRGSGRPLADRGVPGGSILTADRARLEQDVRAIRSAGVGWVRLDLSWAAAEPRRGRFEWAGFDRVLGAARRQGLQVLVVVGYSPTWARPPGTGGHTPPVDPDDFARFAAAAGARYAGDVGAWEVWNEPNITDFWQPATGPACLCPVAAGRGRRAARRRARPAGAQRRARTGDHRRGNIAPLDFLNGVYAAGAGDAFDAVAVHPYSYPALPTDTTTTRWNTFQRLPLLRRVLVRNGHDRKQIWLTEFGAPTGRGTGAVSPQRQAQILAAGYAQARRWPWIGSLFTYSLRDAGTDPGDREQNFGLLTHAGSAKPAFGELARQARLQRGSG